MLGFILRATIDFRDSLSLVSLYKSLVLPHLTYASVIWTPDVNEHFKPIESVQHRLLRLLRAAYAANEYVRLTIATFASLVL